MSRIQTPLTMSIIRALGGDVDTGKCKCPAHNDENPSLDVQPGDKQAVVFKCWAGCSQEAILAVLDSRGIPWKEKRPKSQKTKPPKLDPSLDEYDRFRKAIAILRAAEGAIGDVKTWRKPSSPKNYLKNRGIEIAPKDLRLIKAGTAKRFAGRHCPAAVAPVIKDGKITGAHVIHLNEDATAKATFTDGAPAKKSYGPIKGGYVPLGKPHKDGRLLIAEGIESALSASQIANLPAIAALGTSGMKNLAVRDCVEIIICADNDEAGEKAAQALGGRLKMASPDTTIRIAPPPAKFNDWNDALKADGDMEALRKQILRAPRIKEQAVRALSLKEFCQMQFPPRENLLAPWLKTAGLYMIYALPGAAKTWLMLSAGYAVATGGELLGWHCEREARVLFIDGEMPGDELQERLALFKPFPPSRNFKILSHAQLTQRGEIMPDIGTVEGRKFLNRLIERHQSELIILDSITTLIRSGEENPAEAWREIQQWSLSHRQQGRSIIFLHHEARSGKARGTSAREVVLDAMLRLEKDQEQSSDTETVFKLSFPKVRGFYGEDAAPKLLRLSTQSGRVEWSKESVSNMREQALELLREGKMTKADIARKVDCSRAYISQLAKQIA